MHCFWQHTALRDAGKNMKNILDDFENATEEPSLRDNLEAMKKLMDQVFF